VVLREEVPQAQSNKLEDKSKHTPGQLSETSSVASGKRSNQSGSFRGSKQRRNRKLASLNESAIKQGTIELNEEGLGVEVEEEESQKFKKVVHFVEEHGEDHIELKDLSENDFL
jgi:hypothetical protein